MNRLRTTAVTALLLLAAAGCGEAEAPVTATVEAGASAKPAAGGTLLASGFGQRDEYVAVIAMVRNDADKAGQTVTVQFNLKDKAGTILASGSQVDSFSRVGQTRPVQTQIDVPGGKKVATVEATLLVEDSGAFSAEEFPEIPAGPVTVAKSEYGTGWSARVEVTNPTTAPLKSPGVQVVCYDAAKKIVGGAFTFPELIPPSGKAAVDMDLLTAGKPASCTAYPQPPVI